eukprot:3772328-Prymnesium_polylepis.2
MQVAFAPWFELQFIQVRDDMPTPVIPRLHPVGIPNYERRASARRESTRATHCQVILMCQRTADSQVCRTAGRKRAAAVSEVAVRAYGRPRGLSGECLAPMVGVVG